MDNSNRELVFNRLLNAPRELVFEAWTNPRHLARWYGPNGFTLTTHQLDLKPSGIWRFIMHGPDGTDYHHRVVFQEVVRPERLVYKHMNDEDSEHPASHQMTITFGQVGDKTDLTMRLLFDTAEEMERLARKYGVVEGGHQTLSRLQVWVEGAVRLA